MEAEKENIDVYYTIKERKRAEIKVKGSRFIATASTASTKEAAMEFLEGIRTEFYDANHNCFAYRIGFRGLEYRYSDDGEPSGSAGKPILFSIGKFGYSDIIVVVTRIFGGTKLGVGGLARAYSEAAETALADCTKRPVHRTISVTVHCIYEDISPVKRIVEQTAISFEDHYSDSIVFEAEIPISKVESFCAQITSATSARAGTVIKDSNNE